MRLSRASAPEGRGRQKHVRLVLAELDRLGEYRQDAARQCDSLRPVTHNQRLLVNQFQDAFRVPAESQEDRLAGFDCHWPMAAIWLDSRHGEEIGAGAIRFVPATPVSVAWYLRP